MRYLWAWTLEPTPLDRIPVPLRALIGGAFAAWALLENVNRFPQRAPWSMALSVVTTAAVLIAVGYLWVFRRTPSRSWPCLVVVMITGALGIASIILQGNNDPGQVAVFVTVIIASALGLVGLPVAVVVGLIYVICLYLKLHGVGLETRILVTAGGVLSVAAAYLLPLWSRYLWSMREQAAATRERERLAREMHDVLAHTLSGLTVQLEATRLLAEQQPGDPAVAVAVDKAHRLAREGLLEARRAVSALRGEVPGPAQLERLLHDFEVESGIRCRLDIEGTPVALKPDAQLALYRTAQEALTNIRKHADATSVVLRLVWSRRAAELTVEDEGTPKPSLAPGGFGLSGIRERAALLGGSLEAGPVEGGFRVRVRVPA